MTQRAPLSEVDEQVVLVGDSERLRPELQRGDYRVSAVSLAQARDGWGLKLLPVLLICNPAGELVYAGGHLDRAGDPVSRDLAILADLRAGRTRDGLAVPGACLTSPELLGMVDPVGFGRMLEWLGSSPRVISGSSGTTEPMPGQPRLSNGPPTTG